MNISSVCGVHITFSGVRVARPHVILNVAFPLHFGLGHALDLVRGEDGNTEGFPRLRLGVRAAAKQDGHAWKIGGILKAGRETAINPGLDYATI